jgi:hypothetical protein
MKRKGLERGSEKTFSKHSCYERWFWVLSEEAQCEEDEVATLTEADYRNEIAQGYYELDQSLWTPAEDGLLLAYLHHEIFPGGRYMADSPLTWVQIATVMNEAAEFSKVSKRHFNQFNVKDHYWNELLPDLLLAGKLIK